MSVDLSRQWDVVIVGTGMGGATLGRELAMRGLAVLFLERGGAVPAGQAIGDAQTSPEARLAAGWWPHPITQLLPDGRRKRFHAPIGCALGGSTIHYAAALERLAPSDFDELRTNGQVHPPWPVSHGQFVPYYEAAERLFGIRSGSFEAGGGRFSEWDLALVGLLRARGLAPEPLQVAIRYDAECRECIGIVCARDCKGDARTVCLAEALRQPGCAALTDCEVRSLESDATGVRAVNAVHAGREVKVRGRVFVLSAGAMHTPQILLRSANQIWPRGLANRSGQVGRNLMFHTADVYAVLGPRRLSRTSRQKKSISLRDFYLPGGERLGYVQSMGFEVEAGVVAVHLKERLRRMGVRNELVLALLAKPVSRLASLVLGRAGLFGAMTEDDPRPENRVEIDATEPDGAVFRYEITADLRRRADELYRRFADAVKPWWVVRLTPELAMNHGHPCGTCRFGRDPTTSVLNEDCRAHDLDNLFVVDASFMPRSGAINPSLTIAANALRVAPRVAAAAEA